MKLIWNMALLCGVLFVASAFGQSAQPSGQNAAKPAAQTPASAKSAAAEKPAVSDDNAKAAPQSIAAEELEEADSTVADSSTALAKQADGTALGSNESVKQTDSMVVASNESEDKKTQSVHNTVAVHEPSDKDSEEKPLDTETSQETQTVKQEDGECGKDEECGESHEDDELAASDGDEDDDEIEEELEYVVRGAGMKLGILNIESLSGDNALSAKLTQALEAKLNELGLYTVFSPDGIDSMFIEKNMRMPSRCRDSKCVHNAGKALGLQRMIYGTVDRTGLRYAVSLTLLDISMGTPVESVNIQGGEGISAEDVLAHAVNLVHGHKEEAEITKYFGPQVSNLRELMWSTAAVQVTGLFYSVFNYGTGTGRTDGISYAGYTKEKLSGVAASADIIPLFARPAALANAYVAASDDAYGVLYNPAGLAWIGAREAAAAYQSRFGLDLIAATYVNKAARDLGFGHALLLSTDHEGIMTEMYFISAAAYKFNSTPFGPLSFGAAFKMLSNSVNAKSPDSPQGQSIGAALDLGFMWEMSERIRYGLLFRGVPSINRWKNRTTSDNYYESHAATLTMGGSYRASYSSFFIAEGQIPLYQDQPWIMSGGIEYEFFRIIALRVGLQREILDESADWWKVTGGMGLRFDTEPIWGKSLNLDVAYEYNTLRLFPVINVSAKLGF